MSHVLGTQGFQDFLWSYSHKADVPGKWMDGCCQQARGEALGTSQGAHLLAHLLPPGSPGEDLFEEVMCTRRSAGPNTFASLRGEMTVRRGLFQERHTPRQRHSPRRGKQVQGLRESQTAGCAGGRVGVGGCGLLTRHHGTDA